MNEKVINFTILVFLFFSPAYADIEYDPLDRRDNEYLALTASSLLETLIFDLTPTVKKRELRLCINSYQSGKIKEILCSSILVDKKTRVYINRNHLSDYLEYWNIGDRQGRATNTVSRIIPFTFDSYQIGVPILYREKKGVDLRAGTVLAIFRESRSLERVEVWSVEALKNRSLTDNFYVLQVKEMSE
ncbi:hypothetical protein [Leptospira stimsonii]|uniref:Uncharacterized protein n=1 Tax=Leptospira stimsonii TaxID=2202203 RepID=A0A4R9L9M1_9LEPT|nr:hypothetical protein [Leptospira stimsonii]RHX85884.1 hypothetical protein DLM78_08250 [Leptospira stimsonii]TGK19631.1 hypothetical protein EHO98_10030 [Leptospira stimsonii]TGM17143.1 hypothetical protein EHQ90_08200 [Leptospira stimsonii]